MKKTTRSLICACLVLVMIASLCTAAFAATGFNTNSNPTEDTTAFTLTKHYELIGDTTNGKNPAEDFTVTITPYKVENVPDGVTVSNMPTFSDVTLSGAEGVAKVADGKNYGEITATVTMPTYTAIGDYWYTVKETQGTTAGVSYDVSTYYLHVQVIKVDGNLLRLVTMHKPRTNPAEGQAPYQDAKTDFILNKYSNGSLAIAKKVVGNMGDHTKDFDVDVTFSYPTAIDTECPVLSEIAYSDGETKTITDWTYADGAWTAKVTIGVKDGETVTFTNIPYGVEYTVQEQNYSADGYNVPTYDMDKEPGSESGDQIVGTTWADKKVAGKVSDAEDKVTITNSKDSTIDVGVIVDNAPYIALIVLALMMGFVAVLSRRARAAKQ